MASGPNRINGSGSGTAAAGEKPALRLERLYPVAPEKVWRAWTEPKALIAWFGPGAPDSVSVAEIDVRVGGSFHIAFSTRDGEQHDVSGTYLEVQRPRTLKFTWKWKSTPERESLVTVNLVSSADGQGTQMIFVHEQFHDEAARVDHEGGWTLTFEKLSRFFEQSFSRG
jgi:uncharacterized protein YndB with AHSA1/START domain